jgi:polyhydroxybutyrate depolymerase
MFHGYGSNAVDHESYLNLTALSDERGILYAYPDGTKDVTGQRFWNATDSCCDFYGVSVDDVAYTGQIIDDMESHFAVDQHRLYVFGHSNGGFLAHRLGCDLSSRLAAVVSLAGANWKDSSRCAASAPLPVVEIHGTSDTTISYNGGYPGWVPFLPPYPSAHDTVATWAAIDGCTGGLQPTGISYDLDSSLPGAETHVDRYAGCAAAGVELWTMQGGQHVPNLQPTWYEPVWEFLSAHVRQ